MVVEYFCTKGADDVKHQTLQHSVVTYLTMIFINTSMLVYFSEPSFYYPSTKQLVLSIGLFVYSAIVFVSRFLAESNL